MASELIAQNIHPDQYIPKPKESLYRYIYRPDGSYEPLAQIRKLTVEEREAEQQNNPHYRQIPDYRLPAIEESSNKLAHKTDEVRYYQNHLNGAPEELVDSAGNILWAENPTAWGQDQYDVDSIRKNTHQPIRFQGQYRDTETGLHYNTFRYYNPHCGRFINQDPIGLNGGLNLYQYAPNPISWIDPWGWNKLEHFSNFDKARESAFKKAGMMDPKDISFSKIDPKTGTVVEFKGKNGAKIAYDSPHADMNPAAGHDKPHVGWQEEGKRNQGGAGRGNNTYDGNQHPYRSNEKGTGKC